MSKNRNPNRDKAFSIYKEHKGKITSKEIALKIGENEKNIEYWRKIDKWKQNYNPNGGAPIGNNNALAHKGVTPKGNLNSFKYGNYTKRIPMCVNTIMQELDIEDPLEKLWRSICLQEARIINMQKIMHVKNRNDITKELKKTTDGEKVSSEEYEIQFAWDKEANLISTQSKALNTLGKLIKQYDDMLHANWDAVTEEQKLRIEKLKVQIKNEKDGTSDKTINLIHHIPDSEDEA